MQGEEVRHRSLNVHPFFGKRWREKVTFFHRTVSDFPTGENCLAVPGVSPQPGCHGRGSSALAPHLACQKKFVFFRLGRCSRPHPGALTPSAQGGPSQQKTARPVFILETRNEKEPARCFLIFSFPFPGLGGIPLPVPHVLSHVCGTPTHPRSVF